jgi:hypothetical protein
MIYWMSGDNCSSGLVERTGSKDGWRGLVFRMSEEDWSTGLERMVYKIDGEDSSKGWVERCGQQDGWMDGNVHRMGGAVWSAGLERTGIPDLRGLVYRMGGEDWEHRTRPHNM